MTIPSNKTGILFYFSFFEIMFTAAGRSESVAVLYGYCWLSQPSLLPGKKQSKKMWRALKSHRMQCIWYFAYFYITNTTASGWRTIYFYHTIALNKNVLRFNHLVKKQNSPNCHHLVVECGAFLARLFILHIENGNMEWNICVHVCIEGWGDEEVPFLLSMSVKHPTQKKNFSWKDDATTTYRERVLQTKFYWWQ